MGRKRKAARETSVLGIIPVHYTKREIEERDRTVIDFTEAIRSRNLDTNKRQLSKDEVTEQFTLEIFREYATEPIAFELLGQLESPAYNSYWAKLASKEQTRKSLPEVEGTSFWITTRKLRPALIKQYPDCVTLENCDLGLVIVPGISLRALGQICYKETIKSIFNANDEIDSLYLYTRQLWTAVVRVVYHFEDAARQSSKLVEMNTPDVEVDNLLESYRVAHQNLPSDSELDFSTDPRHQADTKSEASAGVADTEKGENSDVEEGSAPVQVKKGMGDMRNDDDGKEDVDDEEQALSRKRQKRTNAPTGRWEEFETQLDSAGATLPDFPIALEFADTMLPFRLKR